MTTKVKDLRINGTSSIPTGNGTTSGTNNGGLRHSSNHQDGTNKSKGRSNGNDQLENSFKMEGVVESKKRTFLAPKSDDKIDAFFNYLKQETTRQFDINTLACAISQKYGAQFGVEFAKDLFNDAYFFTHSFTMDIVDTPADQDSTDISYLNNGNTITRYLVKVENNVLSIFRHFLEYAIKSNRPSVEKIILKRKEESELKRANNTLIRKEERETKKVGEKISNMSTDKLLGLLTEDQKTALLAQLMNK